jgi:NodT family efflux transporter outer membrane factor (OMF) lipoprotein
LSWELDFWGLYRRTIAGAKAQVEYSSEDYDNILVTLLGDVGNYYTNVRVLQERIALAKANAELQRGILNITETRFKAGSVAELDVDQAQQTLSQTESTIPQYELSMRQAENHICTLLSIPQVDLDKMLGKRPIPAAPADVAVGIPAELLTRRPDIRKAERQCAVQSEQIGIADANLYPHISITGNMGVSATKLSELYTPNAFNGTVGPTFTWNILNYGRLAANVNYQDHRFQELLLAYRDTVINANEDVENGIVSFLKNQEATAKLLESCVAADKALAIVISQYRVGTVDFNRVATIEQTLVTEQDLYTQSKGSIALGLIQVYRALGGGWQIRIPDSQPVAPGPPSETSPVEKPLPPLPKLDENGANVGTTPVGLAPNVNPGPAPVAPNPEQLPLPGPKQ